MSRNDSAIVKKVMLSLLSLTLFIFVAEMVLRLTYPWHANYNSEMARYAREVKILYNETFFRHRPNKSGIYYGVEIKTNSMGWRENKEYQVKKPSGVKRIIVLGDSITLGWGVEAHQTYSKVLEQFLNNDTTLAFNYEVINTGVGNYNTRLELELLKLGLAYDPDIILLGFFINDAELWHKKSALASILGAYSYLYGFLWDKLLSVGNNLGLSKNYEKYYQKLYTSEDNGISQFEESLNTIISLAKERSIPLVFINIPDLHHTDPYPFSSVNSYLEKLVSKGNILYLNLLKTVMGIKSTTLWVSHEDPHPNAIAHRIYSNRIYHFLKKEELVD